MSKQQDLLKIQSCVLKVNIHCDGCEQKVKKLLQKIHGVYSVRVDADQGKVLVAGDVDPATLVKKLKRGGKHAEIWGGQKGMMYNQNYPINLQIQNMHLDNGKGGKDNNMSQNQKGQKGGGGGGGQGQVGQLAHFPNTKVAQDLKVPAMEQKSVKFKLPEEEFDASDDGFDEYEDNFDDYDEEEEDEEEFGDGHGHPMHNKMMPIMGDGRGPHGMMVNGPAINNSHKDNAGGSRNGSVKKGDVIDQAMLIEGKGGNYNEAKNNNHGKMKSNQKGENKKGDWDKPKKGGGGDDKKKKSGKSEDGLLGRFLGFGKKSKKKKMVELEEATYTNKSKNQNNGGENKKGKEGKLEDYGNNKKSKNNFDFHDYDDSPIHPKNGKVGQMGPSPTMGHQMENIPAVQGLPAMKGDGGYYQGMQIQHAPYNNILQQQQYMGMLMNQHQHQHQQANMNNMYPTSMMYGRPHPSMNYMLPPPMPSHPMADPVTHTFSDENVESCNIM